MRGVQKLSWVVAFLSSWAWGCGATVDDGGSGGSGTGGASSSGSGAGGACSGFEDATPTETVTLRITNQAPVDIYLPNGCGILGYRIERATPSDVSYGPIDYPCSMTCEDLQSQPQILCGACAPTSRRLAPGESVEVEWPAVGLRSVSMPSECWLDSSADATCSQLVAAESGTYAPSIDGFSSCGSTAGTCTCDASGECNGDVSGQAAYPLPVEFSLPGAGLVEIVFEPCTFGCPQPGG